MIQNKADSCYNCGKKLNDHENYCPDCGQKNTDLNISMKDLIKEFVGDYFTFDSKFFRTIGPLIIKPGRVPSDFINGKRVVHIPPLRVFIFLSFITFFLWGLSFERSPELEGQNQVDQSNMSGQINNTQSFLDSINEETPINLNLKVDSGNVDTSTSPTLKYLFNKENDPQEIVDSLAHDEGELTKKFMYQALRMYQAEDGSVKKYLMGNISIVLLLLQPFFALLLKLVYIRRKSFFYIEHLVFSLYFHAFILITTIALFFLSFYFDTDYLILWLLLISFIYLWMAIKRFYEQSWMKSFWKSAIVSFLYMTITFPATITVYFILSLYFY